jgi:hypothetical protein
VKRGLRAFRRTQLQAALAIGKSPALISRVLADTVTSQPCLDALAAWLNRGAPLATVTRPRPERAPAEASGC